MMNVAILRRETTADHYLPYIRHADDHTIVTREGGMLQMIRLDGAFTATVDNAAKNLLHERLNTIIRNIAHEKLTLSVVTIRREEPEAEVGHYPASFAKWLDERYRARLFIAWTRAETPNGVVINLDSPATDALGRTGVDGDIDTQFWTRFGGTMMLSIIDDALIIAAQREGQGGFSHGENSANAVEKLAQTELESTINVPVILRKNQGEQVSIMVARDLDFSGVYRLSGN